MSFFSIDIRKLMIITLLVGLPLVSINVQRKDQEIPWYLLPFNFVSSSIQTAYSSFSSGVRGTTGLYLDLVDIKKTNRELTKTNAQLKAKLGEMTELKLENQRLNELLDFKQKSKMDLLAAKVIGKDIIQDHDSITINRGSRDNVKKGLAAITVSGVVGYVVKVDLFSSQILLLTDRYVAIDSIIQRSRARGLLQGGPQKGFCAIKFLQRGDDVAEGDLAVTSGLDNVFPKGFPIGTVTKVVKSQYGVTQNVTLKPAINPSNLEEIFIVLNANNRDFEEKISKTDHSFQQPEVTNADTLKKNNNGGASE